MIVKNEISNSTAVEFLTVLEVRRRNGRCLRRSIEKSLFQIAAESCFEEFVSCARLLRRRGRPLLPASVVLAAARDLS